MVFSDNVILLYSETLAAGSRYRQSLCGKLTTGVFESFNADTCI